MAMILRFGLLADYATVGAGGKATIVHTFDQLRPTPEKIGQPIPPCFLVARIEGSIADAGSHTLRIRLHDSDENVLPVEIVLEEFTLGITGPGLPLARQIIVPMEGIPMPQLGDYEFVFNVDEVEIGRVPFYVVPAIPAAEA